MPNLDLPPDDCQDDCKQVRAGPLLASLFGMFRRKPDPRPHPIPVEIYQAIVFFAVDLLIDEHNVREYRLQHGILEQRKTLVSLMLVSRLFYELVCTAWNRHWLRLGLPVPNMLILVDIVSLFKLSISPIDLSPFAHLRFASLNCEDAFEYRNNAWHPLLPIAGLPSCLRELEILWSHASEHEIIDLAGRLCPNITALRVVFCTMFNRPRCLWWAGHQGPEDHHHYLKGRGPAGVEEYARTIALALHALPHLKSLHLGVYFVEPQAVNVHCALAGHARQHSARDSRRWLDRYKAQNAIQFGIFWDRHHPGFPAPQVHIPCLPYGKVWEKSCSPCIRQWSARAERAEKLAASILAIELWSLKTVSFGSFVTEGRIQPSEWQVCRSDRGTQVWVRARRPGTDCSLVKPLLFHRSRGMWVQVESPM